MRSNGSNLWRNNTPTEGLSNALLAVWPLVDVEPQENRVIAAAVLATHGDVVGGDEISYLVPDTYRSGHWRVNLCYGTVAPYKIETGELPV